MRPENPLETNTLRSLGTEAHLGGLRGYPPRRVGRVFGSGNTSVRGRRCSAGSGETSGRRRGRGDFIFLTTDSLDVEMLVVLRIGGDHEVKRSRSAGLVHPAVSR